MLNSNIDIKMLLFEYFFLLPNMYNIHKYIYIRLKKEIYFTVSYESVNINKPMKE